MGGTRNLICPLLILTFYCIIGSIEGLNVKSEISHDLADAICQQMRAYAENPRAVQDPLNKRVVPPSPDRCGWHRFGNCGSDGKPCSYEGKRNCDGEDDSNVRYRPQIVGGEEAPPHKYPSIVSLRKRGFYTCGGTILNENWVATAGHCVSKFADEITFHAGKHHRTKDEDTEQAVKCKRLIRHPDYTSTNTQMTNDIALCEIDPPFQFNENVRPVILPDSSYRAKGQVTAVGWGVTSSGGRLPDYLQHVNLTVIDDGRCADLYNKFTMTEKEICTLSPGKDGCQGDSGGPLYNARGNDHTLVGITSWGIGCAGEKAPGVWTEVAHFIPWIREQMGRSR